MKQKSITATTCPPIHLIACCMLAIALSWCPSALQAETPLPAEETPTLHVFIGLGQSLMVGGVAKNSLVSTPPVWPDRALMFDSGASSDVRMGLVTGSSIYPVLNPDTLVGFVPLEAKAGQGGYDRGETPMEAFANTLTAQAAAQGEVYRSLSFMAAHAGTNYSQMKKGTQVYANLLAGLTKAVELAQVEGWNVVVPACLVKHGESDIGNSNYLNDLLEWRNDVDADIKAITGQSADVHFIIGQPSSHGTFPESSLAMLEAHQTNPYHHVAGPDYPFAAEYADNLHMNGPGYFMIGEQMARAYQDAVAAGGGKSRITQITQAQRDGITVTLSYEVPVAPLVFDTTIVPERDIKGFRFFDSSGEITVLSAAIRDDATFTGVGKIELELGQLPNGENEVVDYAMGPQSNPRTEANRPRGNVRDSAPETSAYDGRPLYNWGVTQRTPVTEATISLNDSPTEQTLPQNSAALHASVKPDAELPVPAGDLVYRWAVIAGPGETYLAVPDTQQPTLVMSAPGLYQVRVRALLPDESEIVAERMFTVELKPLVQDPTVKSATLTDDAFGHKANSNTNYGSDASILIKDRTQTANAREGFFKFTLPPTENMEILGVQLRLYRTTAPFTQSNELVLLNDNSWTEGTLTWNNRPTAGAAVASWSDDGATGWVELDLDPSALASQLQDGVISFRLSITAQADSGPTARYASKDGANQANRAQLLVTGREIQSYQDWLAQENIPASEQAPDFDRFGTGISNQIAYLSGISAEAPESPISRLETGTWQLSLPWRAGLPPTAFFVIEQSTNLQNWSPLPWNQWQASTMTDGRRLFETTLSLDDMILQDAPAAFLRLRMAD